MYISFGNHNSTRGGYKIFCQLKLLMASEMLDRVPYDDLYTKLFGTTLRNFNSIGLR